MWSGSRVPVPWGRRCHSAINGHALSPQSELMGGVITATWGLGGEGRVEGGSSMLRFGKERDLHTSRRSMVGGLGGDQHVLGRGLCGSSVCPTSPEGAGVKRGESAGRLRKGLGARLRRGLV